MNGSSSTIPAASIMRRVMAPVVKAMLRHIQRRWAEISRAMAWRIPRAVVSGHSSDRTVKPAWLMDPPWALWAKESPDTAPIATAATYSQPPNRCSPGRRRRTVALSCSGTSKSASPAAKKCAGTSQPDTANCAANGSSVRNSPYRYAKA